MPNVAPRGLHARVGSTWKPPLNVYARVGGVWKQADYVWARSGGTWQLIWGRVPSQPATATATWVQPATVRIDWTPPTINTNTQWIVRRSDASIVGTVPVGTLTITDTRPLLYSANTANAALAAYTVEGSDGSTSSTRKSTNTVTFNFTPATQSTSVAYPSGGASTVTINWTPNATYGRPQGWQPFSDQYGWIGGYGAPAAILPGTATTTSITGQPRGVINGWRIVPMTQAPDGTWAQAGNSTPIQTSLKAVDPASVAIAATNPPLSTLRLTWAHPSGSRTGYEVQRYVASTGPWAAHASYGTGTTSSEWGTTVAGYMRVRTLSDGGPSDWVQAGPATPINDTSGPVASLLTIWQPEASYGRMVARGNWSTSPDAATGVIYGQVAGGGWFAAWGPAAITPGSGFAVAVATGSAGQNMECIVRTWDSAGNQGTDAYKSYVLAASPIIINPSGDLSGTNRNGAWRNDSTRSATEIATGWTGSGHNIGCFFYGTAIASALAGRSIVSATISYYRENEGGLTASVQPLFWLHNLPGRTATPTLDAAGVAEGSRLGGGCTRATPPSTSAFGLPSQFIGALQAGSALGLAMYRGYQGSGDPDSYYGLFGIGGSVGSGVTDGQLAFNHLG